MSTVREVAIVCINGGKLGGKTEEMLHNMSAGCDQMPTKHPDWHTDVTVVTMHLSTYVTSLIMNYLYTGRFRGEKQRHKRRGHEKET